MGGGLWIAGGGWGGRGLIVIWSQIRSGYCLEVSLWRFFGLLCRWVIRSSSIDARLIVLFTRRNENGRGSSPCVDDVKTSH